MGKKVRYSAASAVTGLTIASVLSSLSTRDWDLRKRENRAAITSGVIISALVWTATLG